MRLTHLVNTSLKDGVFKDIQFDCKIIPISYKGLPEADTINIILCFGSKMLLQISFQLDTTRVPHPLLPMF
jgi:hypothetical protein